MFQIDKENMLELLKIFEEKLPQMLAEEELWNSVLVNYHHPFVERLWRNWGENRVYLHKIYPCEKNQSLFHPHPWPQAAKVLSGSYEMGLGYGEKENKEPSVITTVVVTSGTAYEMLDQHAWHYVRPLNEPSLSIMITGKPWELPTGKEKKKMNLPELTKRQQNNLIHAFSRLYQNN